MRRSAAYTFAFAAAVCVVCSLAVSSARMALKERQERNAAVDMQKNILRAVGFFPDPARKPAAAEVERLFAARIREITVDPAGRVVEKPSPAGPVLLPVYIRVEDGRPAAYAIPVSGKGLWSTIKGYIALEPDADTVRGVTFYEQGETPGLGAEITAEWFQNGFKGKKILDAKGRLVAVAVAKGKVAGVYGRDRAPHYVDGISGATMTGKGVTRLLRDGLKRYAPYLAALRARRGAAR